ncbi:MAG: SAM-dependent methyltransferase [Treponema sp.]|nr:SAM-dependent methyltransferase [Treponema sp.]
MLISATLSKPTKIVEEKLGRNFQKIRIARNPSVKISASYEMEMFTDKQAFHKTLTEKEAVEFIEQNSGSCFKNVTERTDREEITILTNKHGETKTLRKPLKNIQPVQNKTFNRKKNYIIPEDTPVPFLTELGVMTKDGKVISQKYDKFRQINRFLEFIDDIIDDVIRLNQKDFTEDEPLRVIDFGSGKSYLTFATYYFLNDIKKIPCRITGLDLKEDVIKECSALSKKLNCLNLDFKIGNIEDFDEDRNPDIIITLHACNTATDYALNYAVTKNAKAILSVPCCQHEINTQLEKSSAIKNSSFSLLAKYGLIRERFSALVTDALRAELLEQQNYNVQILEFIDMSHTPKNILIRAVKKQGHQTKSGDLKILDELKITQTLNNLLSRKN